MNLRDLLVEIRTRLLDRNWAGSSNRVFGSGSVVVTKGLDEEALRAMRCPAALVIPGQGRSDPVYGEEPDLLVNTVTVRLFQTIPGDALGQNPIIGANRPNANLSEGAGLLEIAEEVYNAIGRLNDEEDVTIQFRRMGEGGPVLVDNRPYWTYQDIEFEAICTAT